MLLDFFIQREDLTPIETSPLDDHATSKIADNRSNLESIIITEGLNVNYIDILNSLQTTLDSDRNDREKVREEISRRRDGHESCFLKAIQFSRFAIV
jgi:hypothetical protein